MNVGLVDLRFRQISDILAFYVELCKQFFKICNASEDEMNM